jgi:hypothetical protein
MAMRVTGGLRPPCPVGISGWLLAASVDPSVGQSHDPLFLAVIDPASGTISISDLAVSCDRHPICVSACVCELPFT